MPIKAYRGPLILKASKSKRYISANIPYSASYPSNLVINNASFIVEQDIFVEGILTRNNKTKETRRKYLCFQFLQFSVTSLIT